MDPEFQANGKKRNEMLLKEKADMIRFETHRFSADTKFDGF